MRLVERFHTLLSISLSMPSFIPVSVFTPSTACRLVATPLCQRGRRRHYARFSPRIRSCAPQAAESEPALRYQDDGTRVVPVDLFVRGTASESVVGVYATMDEDREITFVSMSRDVARSLNVLVENQSEDLIDMVKVMTFAMPSAADMKLVVESWIRDNGDVPLGNIQQWREADEVMEPVLRAVESAVLDAPMSVVSPFETTEVGMAESAEALELTEENVDAVLNEVRPYLISDGGNISVLSVDSAERKIKVQLEGACGSCSSAATTMQMGVEKALRAKFGENLGEVVAVSAPESASGDVTPEACERVLDEVRDALRGLGASVSVAEVDEDEVIIRFNGPNNLKYGIELLLKERLPVITTVTFEEPSA